MHDEGRGEGGRGRWEGKAGIVKERRRKAGR